MKDGERSNEKQNARFRKREDWNHEAQEETKGEKREKRNVNKRDEE